MGLNDDLYIKMNSRGKPLTEFENFKARFQGLIAKSCAKDKVDEILTEFTHTVAMDFLLPGVPPTGHKVAVGIVVVAGFRDGKLAREHIYWDQASVLVQLGLLRTDTLPVVGRLSADKLRDDSIPFNELIER